ncbi:unnamed protein product [Pleuronectes platessa]|uniref:Uncharacterized protein n=1 Tax=Pleuronectes platessa TaxID=8262 RepID=A0A9N7USG5_PLEPL|nr:unnamed protein product [Pleuronectes platessa]
MKKGAKPCIRQRPPIQIKMQADDDNDDDDDGYDDGDGNGFKEKQLPRCADNRPVYSRKASALWSRKRSRSDVLYGPSRLGRNQDVLLGAGMIVSALVGRFVSLQVIS